MKYHLIMTKYKTTVYCLPLQICKNSICRQHGDALFTVEVKRNILVNNLQAVY